MHSHTQGMHACAHAHTHAHTRTCAHTHTHTRTHLDDRYFNAYDTSTRVHGGTDTVLQTARPRAYTHCRQGPRVERPWHTHAHTVTHTQIKLRPTHHRNGHVHAHNDRYSNTSPPRQTDHHESRLIRQAKARCMRGWQLLRYKIPSEWQFVRPCQYLCACVCVRVYVYV